MGPLNETYSEIFVFIIWQGSLEVNPNVLIVFFLVGIFRLVSERLIVLFFFPK